MRTDTDWKSKFDQEIHKAEVARQSGNEGMARVCARRAAGIVIKEYLQRQGIPDPGSSAYDLLRYLQSLSWISPPTRQAAGLLLLRVNSDHSLPADADLIQEANLLIEELLSPSSK